MSGSPPEDLKYMTPYLQRAHELQAKEPVVAYYCKFYALKLAISKGGHSKEAQGYLGQMLEEVEQDKKNLAGNEAITNDVVGYAHLENFALKIFLNADAEDRQGRASKKTAKVFLAASIFLDLLRVFGEIDAEIADKIRYSKFKAADIIKALREGRTPTPGLPGEELPPDESESAPPGGNGEPAGSLPHPDFGSPYDPSYDPNTIPRDNFAPPSAPSSHFEPNSYPPPQSQSGPSYPQYPDAPPPSQQPYNPPPSSPKKTAQTSIPPSSTSAKTAQQAYEINYKAVQSAQKHSKFAISALQYDDVASAIENLEKALAILRPLRK
ncbi:Vta1 like-domain-containing protein [Fimicolochytrium jonesii]|uniref:Vta1 like-domain-containing protein n=1 Tax=Fimicolochytrium jonesii TaxID=1396493 RepID=UPI0022FE3DE6|nr:Vta1 like-domain-containing protein [Fimicolochytrium jonesii]KAI8826932.1 Vta1 like-domain-containing protein [Fimicolochytrium jonesii]